VTEYDSPWKEILDNYFEDFLQLCFPQLHQAIDWATPPKTRDKEFQQIAQASETGPRSVDKLVEVRLLSGQIEWLLVHLEVQSQTDAEFARRMFIYYYRIIDKFSQPVVSMAVLGDNSPTWNPGNFQQSAFGCEIEFRFPTVKLLDFSDHVAELEKSANPFATVILAHLMTLKTVDDPDDRCRWKMRLMRPLYQRGMPREVVRDLFKMIDWMMDLPTDIALQFEHQLLLFEQDKQMPYVTSIERHGIEKGLEKGIEKGELIGQIRLYQKLLSQPEQTSEQLQSQALEALQSQLTDLQQAFANQHRN
jgi:hypothetical protein